MRLDSVSFENYKAFANEQKIRLRPITLLLGKNSSGKSSIAKIFTLLENSLSGRISEPLRTQNDGVELGAEFRDLVFERGSTPVVFGVEFGNGRRLKVKVIQNKLNYTLDIIEWSLDDFTLQYTPETGYTDANGDAYHVKFRGFIPYELSPVPRTEFINFAELSIDVDYIGPFRFLPQRQFYLTGQVDYDSTGIKGENAYAMLGVSKRTNSRLLNSVGKWFEDHFDGWRLVVEVVDVPGGSSFFQVFLQKPQTRIQTPSVEFRDEMQVNIVDVGQGMNQVLPLIVRAFSGKADSIVVVEQPELHLHPAAHGDLAELFARSAKEHNQIFVIETHAENILLRLRALAVENDFGFTSEDLVIYWADESESVGQDAEEITVSEDGVLSDWREGVFNENVKEILDMQRALKRKSHS